MAARVLHVRNDPDDLLHRGIQQIQAEQHVTPDFPAEVELAAARAAVAPRLPDLDRTDIPFVTIDPASAMDLDQAMRLQRTETGYLVHYAIADVTAFLAPGDPVDAEANRRGETLYGADSTVPLHPTVLSEDAASLLPDQVRPAFVWTLELDRAGECTRAHVERARVRSRAKLDYTGVQADGSAELFGLLREIGELRLAREADRGGVDLPLPEQVVDIEGDTWTLEFRDVLPVESWNAQISLLTGFAAARMMLQHGIGLLRTLPPVDPRSVARLRRTAQALRVDWPAEQDYPDFIRGLDARRANEAAMLVASTSLLRGAAYVAFDGTPPEQPEHSALASVYAHCTAPLRRLGDRYALEVCAAVCAGQEVPGWVRERLPGLPETLRESGRRSRAYENAVLDLVEAHTLHGREGESFAAVVLDVDGRDPHKADVQLRDPAVEAEATGDDPPVGEEVQVTLATADPATRKVEFRL